MDNLTAFELFAVAAMLVTYALEERNAAFGHVGRPLFGGEIGDEHVPR